MPALSPSPHSPRVHFPPRAEIPRLARHGWPGDIPLGKGNFWSVTVPPEPSRACSPFGGRRLRGDPQAGLSEGSFPGKAPRQRRAPLREEEEVGTSEQVLKRRP